MSDTNSLLQRFFDASLIPSDTTDERLGHYEAAAADLAKRFGEAPREAVSASRVAIDPKCPASDPWFGTVQEAVKSHWKTFLASHHDAPRQICRATLLEALSKALEKDEELSAAIWYATCSLLPQLGTGPEQVITRQFVDRLGNRCEAYSSSLWQISGKIVVDKLPEFDIKMAPLGAPTVDQAALERGMAAAVGPQDRQGRNQGNNPHWPNNPPNWAYEFAPRAASAIAGEVDKMVGAIGPVLQTLTKELGPALKKHSSALAKCIADTAEQQQSFTRLLWWKQSLYSPALRRGYRDLVPAEVAVAMSFDLSGVSGAPVPQSVEFFLREAIRAAVPHDPSLTLDELAQAVKASDVLEPLLPASPKGMPRRASLREFLRFSREAALPAKSFPACAGIGGKVALRLSEWALWLLRDQLAEILTEPAA